MAKAKKATKTIDSWKKKKWHKVLAPGLFQNQVIGETPALEPEMVMGRTVMVNLMHLTRDIKKQNVNVTFEIQKIQGDTAYTELKSYQINPSYIKRSVRRNRNRIDDSFVCKTKDGLMVQLKPFVLTRNLTNKSINTKIRSVAKRVISNYVAQNTYETIGRDLMSNKLQRFLMDYVRAVYPIKTCEIRMMEVVKGEKQHVVTPGKIDDLKVKERKKMDFKRHPRHALPMNSPRGRRFNKDRPPRRDHNSNKPAPTPGKKQ